jgi:hypothetical protein
MTDRELLEYAAKAAGFHYHGARIGPDYENCYVSITGDTDDWFIWTPLTDDGDARRLLCSLPWMSLETSDRERGEKREGVYLMPTRRAIVRAAAEIGKAMK